MNSVLQESYFLKYLNWPNHIKIIGIPTMSVYITEKVTSDGKKMWFQKSYFVNDHFISEDDMGNINKFESFIDYIKFLHTQFNHIKDIIICTRD